MLDAEARERVIVALDCDREEALSLADNETALVIRQNIAVLYEKEGDFAKALEQFKECQAAGADTPEVQKEIRFLESR